MKFVAKVKFGVASRSLFVSLRIGIGSSNVIESMLFVLLMRISRGDSSKGLVGTQIYHCGEVVVLRVAKTVKNKGKQFWDCP